METLNDQKVWDACEYHKVQGIVYDNLIANTKYKGMHDSNTYKFFCFSNIFLPIVAKSGQIRLLKFQKFISKMNACPVEGINKKTLSIRLKELENGGIIKRRVYNQNPIRAEYLITKKGRMLRPILEQMAAFSLSYCSDTVFEDKRPRSFKEIVGRSPSSLQ